MAVPGAKRRKPTDDLRTGGAAEPNDSRFSGGMSATPGSDGQQRPEAAGWTGADGSHDTGKLEVRILNGSAETGGRSFPKPPAIGVVGEPTVLTGRSGRNSDGDSGSETVVGERGICPRSPGPYPRTPKATVIGE